MTAKASTAQTIEFLAALYTGLEGGYVESRALPSRMRRFAPLAQLARIGDFAQAQRAENVYVGVATRRDESSGTLENCRQLGGLHADIDFKMLAEPDARARLERFPFPPSIVVATGGGLHGYWLLREPLELPAEEPSARDALRRLAIALGADLSAAECARVLRLPGTFNYKYAPPARVRLELIEPGRRYNLSELLDFLPREAAAPTEPAQRFTMPPAAGVGDRHLTLFRAGRSLKTRGLSPDAIVAALRIENERCCVPPLDDREVQRVVDSVFQQQDRPGFEPKPMTEPGPVTRVHLTDAGNAERFAAQHGAWARFCWAWRSWLLWTGTHWRRDDGDGALRLAKAVAKQIYLEVEHAPAPADRERIAKWAIATESEKRLRAMLALAQAEPGIPVRPEELDVDPWALNVQNGTLNLRTGELRAHRREDLITRCLPVAYDPAAACPLWRATLARILGGRADLIRYFQKAIGYSCTGDTTEQVLFVLWGAGANGKTTILSTAATLLGDYALSTRPETFMVKHGDGIPNDVAQLKGRRLVIAVEAEAGQRLAEGLVKQMTGGGDTLTARFMRAEFFQFTPTFKIFLATNHKPSIRGTDHAIWRRIRLLPFTVTIPDSEQDRLLPEKLKGELPGILAWAIAGARLWQAEGLSVPDVVRVATETYRADMDILGDFFHDRCVLDTAAQVGAGELFDAYEGWCRTTGEKAMSGRAFGLRLKDRGFTPMRTKQGRLWAGARLRSPLDPEPGDAYTPVTLGDASFPISEPRARVEDLTGNMRHQASPDTNASPPSQEELPAWVAEPTKPGPLPW